MTSAVVISPKGYMVVQKELQKDMPFGTNSVLRSKDVAFLLGKARLHHSGRSL